MHLFFFFIYMFLPVFLFSVEEDSNMKFSEKELFLQVFGKKKTNKKLLTPIYIHGKYSEMIQIKKEKDIIYFPSGFLHKHLVLLINSEAFNQLKKIGDSNEWINQTSLEDQGYKVLFDHSSLIVNIIVPAKYLLTQYHKIIKLQRDNLGYQQVFPAAVSGYLNMHLRENWTSSLGSSKRSPLSINFDSVLNIKGWAWQNIFSYTEKRNIPWIYSKQSLNYDIPEKYLKFTLGELSNYSSKLSSLPTLAGFQIQKTFSLDPYFDQVNSVKQLLYLEEKSKIEIWKNGIKSRSFDLLRGPHVLSNLSNLRGLNNFELKVFDQSGNEQKHFFSYVYEPKLLAPGLFEYSAIIGFPSNVEKGLINYDTKNPYADFNLKKGINKKRTIIILSQWRKKKYILGGEAISAYHWGIFEASTVASLGDLFGSTIKINFLNYIPQSGWEKKINWNIQATYFTDGYSPITSDLPTSSNKLSIESSVSYPFKHQIRCSYSANYQLLRAGGSSLRLTGRVSTSLSLKKLKHRLSLNFYSTLKKTSGLSDEWRGGFSCNLSLNSRYIRLNERYSTDSMEKSIKLDHAHRFSSSSLDSGLTLKNSPGITEGYVDLDYSNDRLIFNASHKRSYKKNSSQNLSSNTSMSTSIVYADGSWGISRPVDNSFVLITPHSTLKKSSILINSGPDYYSSSSNSFLPAVSLLTSYRKSNLSVYIPDQPLGSNIGNGLYRITPGFKRGVSITVGDSGTTMLDGYLVTSSEEPLAFIFGKIISTSKPLEEPILFFTNATGRFRIIGVSPGDHEMQFSDSNYLPEKISIPEETIGLYKLDKILIKKKNEKPVSPSDDSTKDPH